MVEIATADHNNPVNISKIAESQDISRKYLESLLVKLKKQEILKSLRGQKGGYMLNRAPDDVSVYEISEALDGPIKLVDCEEGKQNCSRQANCTTVRLWEHLNKTLVQEMKRVKLSDLIENEY